jgi:hypothetical protein
VLHLVRAEDIQLRLVLWDAFAGLAKHDLTFDS